MDNDRYQTLRYDVSDGIATITLDRPPLNLIDREMTLEYHGALDSANEDDTVRVIVLRGAGKGLSAGVNLRYLEQFDGAEMGDFLSLFYVETVRKVRALDKPIIAAVHGNAMEGACTLAFACDMIIAADDARFGYPGVPNLAAPPGMHVWYLQRLIGRFKAAELIFTGEPIAASEAASLGLVTRLVPAAELTAQTRELAGRIAEMSPAALRQARDLMYAMEDMPFSEVPEAALAAMKQAFDTVDSREARSAFLEKRHPVWKGK